MPTSEIHGRMGTRLATTLDETESADVHFKLRTALQLIDVIRPQQEIVADSLVETDMDDDLRGQLRDLGYPE